MNNQNPSVITEADVLSFLHQATESIRVAAPAHVSFRVEPSFFILSSGHPFHVSAYIGTEYTCIKGAGDTVNEAINDFMANLAKEVPSAENLKAKAAKLMALAEAIERKDAAAA